MYHLNAYIIEFTLHKCLNVILSLIYPTQHITEIIHSHVDWDVKNYDFFSNTTNADTK